VIPRSLQLATWILSRLVSENEGDALIGDLAEEYALRSSSPSKWYVQQICASVPPLLWARLRRPAWFGTLGLAFAAYIAVGIVELVVDRVILRSSVTGAYNPLGMAMTFPMVVLIAYLLATFRRGAVTVLAAMMLLAVTVMTLTENEDVPLWYRIAYFFVGPAAAFLGSALRGPRRARS
jgi:hypothetical protein